MAADARSPSVAIADLEMVRVAAVRSVVAAEDMPDFMSDALSLVASTMREAGLAPAGASRSVTTPWEAYFIGPGSGVDEAEWRTELVWPLRRDAEDAVDA